MGRAANPKPLDLIETARRLTAPETGRPTQSDLRRAVSTAYYALFHSLARAGADLFVGGVGAARSDLAWRQVYRSLEHGLAKDACRNARTMKAFPKDVEDFANMFATLQYKRHGADYDPSVRYARSEVVQDIDNAEDAIRRFERVAAKERRAFCAHVLFKTRSG